MPVTIKPTTYDPRVYRFWDYPSNSSADLFQKACPGEHALSTEIFQSSFDNFSAEGPIYASSHGFVRSAMAAYSSHHHLTLRPEDIWFAILVQISFFINSHSEELRSIFVAHSGRKELEAVEWGNIYTADFGGLAMQMTGLIAANVIDVRFREWIMPNFTTTTSSDRVVVAVLMMGAMQNFFSYKFSLCCGLPSVTLLGTRDDWADILGRLEKLPQLGSEPTQFYALLKPVLQYFVMSFDKPTDPAVINFWNKIAHHESGGSGSSYLSGWITAFCVWKPNGEYLYSTPPKEPDLYYPNPSDDIDGTVYHIIDTDDIPEGYASVPVKVDDNGVIYKTRMAAGLVGIRVTSSGDILDEGHAHNYNSSFRWDPNGGLVPAILQPQPGQLTGLDSLQPVSGWWIYGVKEADGGDNEKEQLETSPEHHDDNPKLGCRDAEIRAQNPLLDEHVAA